MTKKVDWKQRCDEYNKGLPIKESLLIKLKSYVDNDKVPKEIEDMDLYYNNYHINIVRLNLTDEQQEKGLKFLIENIDEITYKDVKNIILNAIKIRFYGFYFGACAYSVFDNYGNSFDYVYRLDKITILQINIHTRNCNE